MQCFFFLTPLQCKKGKYEKKKHQIINRLSLSYIYFCVYTYIYICNDRSLHEHTALGPVLPHGWGLVYLLSPTRQRWKGQLRDSFQASAGAAAFKLRLVRPSHWRQGGDVEHIPNTVFRNLGGALHIRHRSHLTSYRASLEHGDGQRRNEKGSKAKFESTRRRRQGKHASF